jgi:hypothetical protein
LVRHRDGGGCGFGRRKKRQMLGFGGDAVQLLKAERGDRRIESCMYVELQGVSIARYGEVLRRRVKEEEKRCRCGLPLRGKRARPVHLLGCRGGKEMGSANKRKRGEGTSQGERSPEKKG